MLQSQFKNKIQDLRLNKNNIIEPTSDKVRHVCSAEIKIRGYCPQSPRSHLAQQQPIIICKKEKKDTKEIKKQIKSTKMEVKAIKKVEPFVPIDIPLSPRSKLDHKFKSLLNTEASTPAAQKQIQIHIQKQSKGKQCLKKLFKKIHKLTEDLAESQKQRIRLQLQLDNLKNIDGFNREKQKDLLKVEGENYKLRSDIDYFKELLKERNNELIGLRNKVPKEVIKQIVVQKPVEVKVQVPKYIPGPERIVQVSKVVENKIFERQNQSLRKRIQDLERQLSRQKNENHLRSKSPQRNQSQTIIPAIVEKPVYLQKPVYVDRPVYIQKPMEKQRVVEVPYQVPVYIDKPIIDEQVYMRMADLQRQIQVLTSQNQGLRNQNAHYRSIVSQLHKNIEILSRHNLEKNQQIQSLLRNTEDYNPIKLREIIKKEIRTQARDVRFQNAQNATTFNPYL